MKMNINLVYRPVTEVRELQAATVLQQTTWAQETITSMPQMAAALLHGGVVIGAFDDGRMVGFNYAFPGFDGSIAYLASHMMVILPEFRDLGIGMRLKQAQGQWALEHGYGTIMWTYDPFESRNAYLNLCKLGGVVRRYIPAFYGLDPLLLPTDRFLIEWDIGSITQPIGPAVLEDHASLLSFESHEGSITDIRINDNSKLLGSISSCRIPVPKNAREMKNNQLPLFQAWQSRLNELCTKAFKLDYEIVSYIRGDEPVNYYVLEAKG